MARKTFASVQLGRANARPLTRYQTAIAALYLLGWALLIVMGAAAFVGILIILGD